MYENTRVSVTAELCRSCSLESRDYDPDTHRLALTKGASSNGVTHTYTKKRRYFVNDTAPGLEGVFLRLFDYIRHIFVVLFAF